MRWPQRSAACLPLSLTHPRAAAGQGRTPSPAALQWGRGQAGGAHQQIVGLEVEVEHAQGVRVLQRVDDLQRRAVQEAGRRRIVAERVQQRALRQLHAEADEAAAVRVHCGQHLPRRAAV